MLYGFAESMATFANTTFVKNSASLGGGAVFVCAHTASLVVLFKSSGTGNRRLLPQLLPRRGRSPLITSSADKPASGQVDEDGPRRWASSTRRRPYMRWRSRGAAWPLRCLTKRARGTRPGAMSRRMRLAWRLAAFCNRHASAAAASAPNAAAPSHKALLRHENARSLHRALHPPACCARVEGMRNSHAHVCCMLCQ